MSPSSGMEDGDSVSPKRWLQRTSPHGINALKNVIFTTARTRSLTYVSQVLTETSLIFYQCSVWDSRLRWLSRVGASSASLYRNGNCYLWYEGTWYLLLQCRSYRPPAILLFRRGLEHEWQLVARMLICLVVCWGNELSWVIRDLNLNSWLNNCLLNFTL
jgi:hypothetical protein